MSDKASPDYASVWEDLPAPAPWTARLLRTGSFPHSPELTARWSSKIEAIEAQLIANQHTNRKLCLHLWKVGPGCGGEALEEHAQSWRLKRGMGIWPDREPPCNWDEDAISDAMAAVLRGDEVPLASYKLLTINPPLRESNEAVRLMRGFGALLQFFSDIPVEEIEANGRQLFLPAITSKRFRKSKFFLPLLDRNTLKSIQSADQLSAQLCGATTYIRESAEDHGILIITSRKINWKEEH